MPKLVTIDGLTKRFHNQRRPALENVTTQIEAGRIVGLVGPDGAGKTTLLRLIAGLLRADDGRIEVAGLDPVTNARQVRRRIAYMPQRFGLYEDLSVEENLILYADLRGVVGAARKKTFERLLEFTGLGSFTDRLAGALSGGMKQKLGLACALVATPELLLLDEPSVGVDPISRRELWRMVGQLTDEGITVVWATAYLDEAEQCETVLVLSEGKFIFDGRPEDLAARVEGRVFLVEGIEGDRRQALNRARQHEAVLDGTIQASDIRLLLSGTAQVPSLDSLTGGPGARLRRIPPRFEDAFIDLIGGGFRAESAFARNSERSHDAAVVVEARGLTRMFGSFIAASEISFDVRRGEVFGLIGPNGAGKSTTFKMLCGLLKPTSGEARIAGVDLRTAASQARARLGYMAQKFSLYGDLSTLQNLRFFARVYGLTGTKQRLTIERMIDSFALADKLDENSSQLPLGFKQRLSLACATMHEPDVLFLDEPTSGVDPRTRREFWAHINTMVTNGVTVIVTTHFLDEAEYCDRAALIYRGGMIALGTPHELKDRAISPEIPSPTFEDAFIALVEQNEAVRAQ
ncbi:ATP-binding cassette domain-containing protein [Erythrobacter sp. SN021]|uniref:ATP-binding cassette domain-containing protein n=1 Tax=Erythrobacter sp. SN021 TaxID=2912574 RepID=UPI0021064C21|nr:ATP-binding cassette domain-containing protein [Erythrobacter sp. SN021]